MIYELPYQLTTSVTATRDGLVGDVERIGRLLDLTPERENDPPIIQWPDVAERLRYRKGEPGCEALGGLIQCFPASDRNIPHGLHRLAAILCDTAEGFRLLHWCVENFAGV